MAGREFSLSSVSSVAMIHFLSTQMTIAIPLMLSQLAIKKKNLQLSNGSKSVIELQKRIFSL